MVAVVELEVELLLETVVAEEDSEEDATEDNKTETDDALLVVDDPVSCIISPINPCTNDFKETIIPIPDCNGFAAGSTDNTLLATDVCEFWSVG